MEKYRFQTRFSGNLGLKRKRGQSNQREIEKAFKYDFIEVTRKTPPDSLVKAFKYALPS